MKQIKSVTWGIDANGFKTFTCIKCGNVLGKSKTLHWFDFECGCEKFSGKNYIGEI